MLIHELMSLIGPKCADRRATSGSAGSYRQFGRKREKKEKETENRMRKGTKRTARKGKWMGKGFASNFFGFLDPFLNMYNTKLDRMIT